MLDGEEHHSSSHGTVRAVYPCCVCGVGARAMASKMSALQGEAHFFEESMNPMKVKEYLSRPKVSPSKCVTTAEQEVQKRANSTHTTTRAFQVLYPRCTPARQCCTKYSSFEVQYLYFDTFGFHSRYSRIHIFLYTSPIYYISIICMIGV